MNPDGKNTKLPSLNNWIIEARLGEGAQAEAYRVHRKDDAARTPFVAKVLKPWTDSSKAVSADIHRARFVREVANLKMMSDGACSGIVSVVDTNAALDNHTDTVFYVMPFYEAGSLVDSSGKYVEPFAGAFDRVLTLCEKVARTLACLHALPQPIVHRDVHTGNIFLSRPNGDPTLGDFGLSRTIAHQPNPTITELGEEFGPWRWRPPELTQASTASPTAASDVYMLGGVLYELLSGGEYIDDVEPTPGQHGHESKSKNLASRYDDPRIPVLNTVLRHVLVRDPFARLSAAEFADALAKIRVSNAATKADFELPGTARLQAAVSRLQRTRRIRRDQAASDLFRRACELADTANLREERKRWQLSRIIDPTGGSDLAGANEVVGTDAVWGKVRVLVGVDLQRGEIPFFFSILGLGRTLEGQQFLVEALHPDRAPVLISTSFVGDPGQESALVDRARQEMSRLEKLYAAFLEREENS